MISKGGDGFWGEGGVAIIYLPNFTMATTIKN